MKRRFTFLFTFLVFIQTGFSVGKFSRNDANFPRLIDLDEEILGYSFPPTGTKWPFQSGSVWVHVSSGLGVIGYPSFGNRTAFWPMLFSADYSLSPHISIGAYVGYYRVSYDDNYKGEAYTSTLTSYPLGARITLHGTDLINQYMGADIDVKKWDIYSVLSAGIVTRNWKMNSEYSEVRSDYGVTIYPSMGLVVGAKYLINPKFGIHGEFGKGTFGFISFGISGKIF